MRITRRPQLNRTRQPSSLGRALAAACLSIPVLVMFSATALAQPSSHAVRSQTAIPLAQPQPLSSADLNTGGANNGGHCGAYCSTRSGSPSLNGNGGGVATGRPCAGCVGKADNKNPPGQFPSGPVDRNAGYECDRNHGIGRSNPAHTSCTTTRTICIPPAQSVNGTCTPPPRDCKGVVGGTATAADCISAPGGSGGGGFTGGGGGFTGGGGVAGGGGTVIPVTVVGNGAGAPAVLPFTGSDIKLLGVAALLLLLIGSALVTASRRVSG